MNWRWYFPLVLIALAFFGIGMERSTLPNQEIVVQFDADSVNADEAKLAVSEITAQLEALGVTNFHVSELHNGKLTVTYFSTVDVSVIKNLFYGQHKLQFNGTAFDPSHGNSDDPFRPLSNTYRVEVVQIQKEQDSNVGLHGLPVLVKLAKDHYLKPVLSIGSSENLYSLKFYDATTSFKHYCAALLLVDNPSHIFPEVRAGPLS